MHHQQQIATSHYFFPLPTKKNVSYPLIDITADDREIPQLFVTTMATSNERGEEETRYSVDIRMLLAVITVTMAVAFTLGVVIPSHKTKKVEPPEGTTTDLHEPAGQVS